MKYKVKCDCTVYGYGKAKKDDTIEIKDEKYNSNIFLVNNGSLDIIEENTKNSQKVEFLEDSENSKSFKSQKK
jgi:hypothetical protein